MKSSLGTLVQRHAAALYNQWLDGQLADPARREDLISADELRAQSKAFLDALVPALKSGNDPEAPGFRVVREQLADLSLSRARQGFSPRETAQYVLSLKTALSQVLERALAAEDPKLLYQELLVVNRVLDGLSLYTVEAVLQGREEMIQRQTDEINEISTPVIRVWDGVVALPIIGTLDSTRTQIVLENLLQQIVSTGSTIAILDISGVPMVDSRVAQHLIKTVSATRLMGAECIISGIRAEIAQTIVHLGIDLSSVQTKATLAGALKLAFQMLRLEVRRMPTGAGAAAPLGL
ncbi:MAG: STAS domain-containing protein [Hymenobacteraceae bacterium]|nr:STAS domain-containing protein [Hymenobacteraceae bacterium]